MVSMPSNVLETLTAFYTKVLAYKFPQLKPEEIQRMAAVAGKKALEYAKAHPYSTGFAVLNVGLMPVLGTGWMTATLLRAIGFGPLGPIAGSIASWYQATWLGPYIPANSIFAMLQRLGMTVGAI